MRRIVKNVVHVSFEKWKTEYSNNNGRLPTYDDFVGDEKQKLRERLYEEQYGLCCYCCKTLNYPYTNSEEAHIEHFKPKGNPLYSMLSLEYTNLHLSCSGYKSDRETCGHKKDDWFDESLMISPLENNVEALFEYSLSGEIRAKDNNERAKKTIEKLGLDSYTLNRQRKTAIFISGLFEDDFNEDRRKEIIQEYNTPENGLLKSFCNAVLYTVSTSV
jgi:uncharacterized protein (TIGR02646 family)